MRDDRERLRLEDLIDPQEMAALKRTHGSFSQQHCPLTVGPEHLEYWGEKLYHDRRGEVVLVVHRASQEVLLHTKVFYPPGIYRLPSGGVSWGETVSEALRREAYEETGLTTWNEQFLGLVSYEFQGDFRSLPFVSFVFLLMGVEGQPAAQDESERISDFRWLPVSDLPAVAVSLRSLPEDSRMSQDWGRFRALVHDFVAERLGA
jgi:8-oxo-dGTP pyrophosphatase MutT (NUDIX family)